MRYPKLLLVALVPLALAACGNDDHGIPGGGGVYGGPGGPGGPGYGGPGYGGPAYGGGQVGPNGPMGPGGSDFDPGYWENFDVSNLPSCENDVFRRYQDVREACDFERGFRRGDRRRAQECRTYADGFVAAYPSTSCRSEGINPRRPSPFLISAERVRWMMRRYYGHGHGGGIGNQGPGNWSQPNDGLPRPFPNGNGIGQIPAIPQQLPNQPGRPGFPQQNFPQQQPGYFNQQGAYPQPGF